MKTKPMTFFIFIFAVGLLSACGSSGPSRDLPAALQEAQENNGSEQINVVVELPTQAVAASEALASAVEQVADNEAAVVELQATVDGLNETISELSPETSTLEDAGEPAVNIEAVSAEIEVAPAEASVTTDQPAPTPAPVQPVQPVPTVPITDMESLNARMSQAVPDENGQITVSISESELNQVLQSLGTRSNGATASNVSINFSNELIIFEADITRPANGRLFISFLPYVSGGTLQFEVVEVSLDGNRVPNAVVASAEATLNSTLGEAMNQLPQNVVLVDIVVGEGLMTIFGQVQN